MPSLPERRPPRLRVRRLLRRRLMRLWSITLAARRPLLSRISRVLQRPPFDPVRRRLRPPARTLGCCRLRSQGLRRAHRQCPRLPLRRRELPHPRVRGLPRLRMAHPRALRLRPRIRRRRLDHRLMNPQDRLTGHLLRRPMRRPLPRSVPPRRKIPIWASCNCPPASRRTSSRTVCPIRAGSRWRRTAT